MNGRPAVVSAALLASLAPILLAVPAAQAAGIPQPVVLDTFSVRGCPCTFVMTGALEDQGSIVTDSVQAHALRVADRRDGHHSSHLHRPARQPDHPPAEHDRADRQP